MTDKNIEAKKNKVKRFLFRFMLALGYLIIYTSKKYYPPICHAGEE